MLAPYHRGHPVRTGDNHIIIPTGKLCNLLQHLAADAPAFHHFPESGMEGTGQDVAWGAQFPVRLEAHADHLDPGGGKVPVQGPAGIRRLFHGLGRIVPPAPLVRQRSPFDHQHRIDPHQVRMDGKDLQFGVFQAGCVLAREPGHQLEPQTEAAGPDQP